MPGSAVGSATVSLMWLVGGSGGMADEIGGMTGSCAIGVLVWGVVGLSGIGSAAVGVGAGVIGGDAVSIPITAAQMTMFDGARAGREGTDLSL